jgi:putative membrane protein
MKKIKKLLKPYYLFSFFIPFFILFLTYFINGIYWKSDTSPLLGDGFHQYVIFDVTLRNILHGTDSIFYTFTSGLGLNFYALSSYYLGSFLSPLVYFFNLKNMPDAVYLFTLIKFGSMGLTCFISIKNIFKKICPYYILILSTSYSLMSFAVSQLEIKTWLDIFIIIPLILLGLHQLIVQKKRILYFTSLSILFIQNYYFGYMMVIFLTLWYFVQISWDFKTRIKSFLDFTVVSILSGITSLIMILPTFLDLKTHGEKLTKVTTLLTEKSWYLDIFAKNFIGSFDTTKYGSIPMIYVGLIPLLLAVLFFTLQSIKFHVKLAYFILITILVSSFYLQPLDLFWQGMHAPNMFLHRYSWTFSIVIIFLAAESLERLKEFKLTNILVSFSILGFGFISTFIFKKHYKFLGSVNFILTLEFLVAYLLIFWAYTKKYIPSKIFTVSTLLFVCFELSLNSFYQIEGIAKEWIFASRNAYEQDLTSIDSLVKYSKKKNLNFFRTEKLAIQTGNDSMKYNYNGISQFSSVRNTMASSILDKLGFKSSGTNLNLRYQNNSIIMDSLLGVKYNISTNNPQKYGFSSIKTKDNLTLYENRNANSLAFLTNSIYKDVKFNHLTLDNQTHFLNQLSGLNLKYYHRLFSLKTHNVKQVGNRIVAEVDKNGHDSFASVTYTLEVSANSQVYLTLPNLTFSNDNQKSVDITVNNNQKMHYGTNNVFPFFNLGYFNQKQTITVKVTFPDNSKVSFDSPEFYTLDTNRFQQAINKIQQQKVSVTTKHNTITAYYQAQRNSSLFFTIPYDKGWSATQNGKTIKISRAQNGFMKVNVKKGEGKIKLTFIPNGLKEGSIAFLSGISFFIIYNKIRKKKLL